MMRQRMRLVYLGGAAVALLLLASGLTGLTFRPGRSFAFGDGQLLFGAADGAPATALGGAAILYVLLLLCCAALLVYLLVELILAIRAANWRSILRRLGALLLVLALLALLSSLWRAVPGVAEQAPLVAAPPPPPGEPFPTFTATPTWWLILAICAVIAALLAAGIWFFWRRGRQDDRLVALAQAALADIQAGDDLHDAVLRCYREMSRVLREQQGIAREHAMTPREFAQHLAAAGFHDAHIEQLTRLFERVRYGGRRADDRDAREAVACLTAIVAAYGGAS